MKKKLVIAIICSCMIGITACGTQETQEEIVTESLAADENDDEEGSVKSSDKDNLQDVIVIINICYRSWSAGYAATSCDKDIYSK